MTATVDRVRLTFHAMGLQPRLLLVGRRERRSRGDYRHAIAIAPAPASV